MCAQQTVGQTTCGASSGGLAHDMCLTVCLVVTSPSRTSAPTAVVAHEVRKNRGGQVLHCVLLRDSVTVMWSMDHISHKSNTPPHTHVHRQTHTSFPVTTCKTCKRREGGTQLGPSQSAAYKDNVPHARHTPQSDRSRVLEVLVVREFD